MREKEINYCFFSKIREEKGEIGSFGVKLRANGLIFGVEMRGNVSRLGIKVR